MVTTILKIGHVWYKPKHTTKDKTDRIKKFNGNHKVTIQFILELKKIRILKVEKENPKATDKRT